MMFLLGDADQERESLAEDVAVAVAVGGVEVMPESRDIPGPDCNCIKKGLPGKSILGYYFQENMTSEDLFSY